MKDGSESEIGIKDREKKIFLVNRSFHHFLALRKALSNAFSTNLCSRNRTDF